MTIKSIRASENGLDKAKASLVERKLEQLQIYRYIGTSRTVVSKFFNGKPIKEDNFIGICNFLSLDWTEIREQKYENLQQNSISLKYEETSNIDIVKENFVYDKTQKSINVFVSHNINEEDNQFIKKFRDKIGNSGYGITFWQEIKEGKLIADKKSARKEKINNCDRFLAIVSKKMLDEFEKTPRISEEIGLAFSRYRSSLDNQPKIIFLYKDLEEISGIQIPIRDFETSDPIENILIRDWERIKATNKSESEVCIELVDTLFPPITFIDDLNEEDPDQEKWFQASQIPYEQEFFPVPSERLPFEEIEARILEYNNDPNAEWNEVYGVWHFDRNTNLEYTELAKYVIGMGYVCVHLPSGWCFGNYIAIKEIYRVDNRVNFFADKIQAKIRDRFSASGKAQPQGIVFDVEPIDFEFLIEICESKEQIAGSKYEEKFLNELRQLRRVHWFLKDPELKSKVCILLENDPQNKDFADKLRPFSYIQPGMDVPKEGGNVEGNNTTLFLMVYLFEDNLSRKNDLARDIIKFLFDSLFPSGSDETGRADGYHENVKKIKQQMLEKYEKSNGCVLGKIHNIDVGNEKYDLPKLKEIANKRAIREHLSSKLKF